MVKHILKLLSLTLMMSSFSQCSSAQRLEKTAPTTFGEVYCKQWVSGVAEGPSGLDIFVEVTGAKFLPDSIYFRGKVAKLQKYSNTEAVYIGRFISKSKQQRDIIMSGDSIAEYGNTIPERLIKIPFKLALNECVISYIENGKTKYYKLTNVVEKHSIDVPMAPARNTN